MPLDLTFRRLPFLEAVEYFRQALSLPSETWLNLLRSEHDWAWTVAGATKADVLQGLREAIDRAISEGDTLEDFRRDFREVVKRTGWTYKGAEGWRTRVIYQTNLRVAHAAGRRRQMEAVRERRPFWQYRHGGAVQPRERHVRTPANGGFNGLVLPADHEWWRIHYPPNGWGCSCYVRSLSQADLDRLGLTVGEPPDLGTYEWVNPLTGEVEEVPVGVEPEWAYAPGASTASDRARLFAEMLSRMDPDLRRQARAEIARQTRERAQL